MLSLSSLLLAACVAPAQESASFDLRPAVDRTNDLSWLAADLAVGEESLVFSGAGTAGPEGDSETVLLEVDGAGVLGRLHVVNPVGQLRFYFNGSDTPGYEIAARELFSSSGPFRAPLVRLDSKRGMIKFPLPFANGLKLTTTQVSPRYEAGVHMLGASAGDDWRDFSEQALAESSRTVDRYAADIVSMKLPDKGRQILTTGAVTRKFDYAHKLQGHGVVHWVKVSFISVDPYLDGEFEDLMRNVLLEVREAPGSENPRLLVQVPLGDFLGTSPGLAPWASHLVSVDKAAQSFMLRLPIPYRDDFELRMSTDVKLPKDLRLRAEYGFEAMVEPPSMRLRSSFFSMRDVASQPERQLSIAQLEGPGRLVGAVLTTLNPSKEDWDSGSLHLTVDGQPLVSGEMLTMPEQFDRTTRRDGPYAFGYTSRNRYWLYDPIVFRESLELAVDVKHPEAVPMNFEGVLYWYAAADAPMPFDPILEADKRRAALVPERDFEITSGLVEAERMRVESPPTVGQLAEAEFEGASEMALQWKGAARGKLVKLALPVEVSGEWQLKGRFWAYPGGPTLQMSLSGRSLGGKLSLDAEQAGWKEIDLGVQTLVAREHTLLLGVLDPGSDEVGVVLDALQLINKSSQ